MENEETPTQQFVEQIQDFINDGFVTYSNRGQSVYQIHHDHSCMKDYRHLHNWMAFTDLDEFTVLQDQYVSAPVQWCAAHPDPDQQLGAMYTVR